MLHSVSWQRWTRRFAPLLFVLVLAGFTGVFGAWHCCGYGEWCSDPGDAIPTIPSGGGGPSPTAVPTATATPRPLQPCPAVTANGESVDRCYSLSRLVGSTEIDGASAQFDYEPYTAPDWQRGGHSNQTIWLWSLSTGNWCEVGWTVGGYDATFGYSTTPHFYAAFSVNGSYAEWDGTTGPPLGQYGTVHTYKILLDRSTGLAAAYADGVQLSDCRIDIPESNAVDVGLEYTDQGAVNQGVSPHNIQIHDYNGNEWESELLDQGSVQSCGDGTGAYFAWTNFPDFTDSSNILPGNQREEC